MDERQIARLLRPHGIVPTGRAQQRPLCIVLAARHDASAERAFVKILSSPLPGVRRNFAREIRVLRSVGALKGTPRLLASAVDRSFTFHACTHVSGMTLDAFARSNEARKLTALLSVYASLAKWIDDLHGAGVAHRDLSPDHVLLSGRGEVAVVDFGMATPTKHRAPSDRRRCERYDVQALGMMMWEAICGGRALFPYRNPSMRTVVVREIDLVRRAGLPNRVRDLIVGCLAARSEFTPNGLPRIRGFGCAREVVNACAELTPPPDFPIS